MLKVSGSEWNLVTKIREDDGNCTRNIMYLKTKNISILLHPKLNFYDKGEPFGGWVVGGGGSGGGWSKVTLVFCFGPKPKFCSFDLDLDQAEQQDMPIDLLQIFLLKMHNIV